MRIDKFNFLCVFLSLVDELKIVINIFVLVLKNFLNFTDWDLTEDIRLRGPLWIRV